MEIESVKKRIGQIKSDPLFYEFVDPQKEPVRFREYITLRKEYLALVLSLAEIGEDY